MLLLANSAVDIFVVEKGMILFQTFLQFLCILTIIHVYIRYQVMTYFFFATGSPHELVESQFQPSFRFLASSQSITGLHRKCAEVIILFLSVLRNCFQTGF